MPWTHLTETGVNLYPANWTNHDIAMLTGISPEEGHGFTMSVRIEGIPVSGAPSQNPFNMHTVALTISVGSLTMGGPRLGKTEYFGWGTGRDIPEDGVLVVSATVGMFNDGHDIGLPWGSSLVHLPEGIEAATIAAFFHPITMSKTASYSGEINVIYGEQDPEGGEGAVPPDFVESVRNFKGDEISAPQPNGDVDLTFSFDYDNALGEDPPQFVLGMMWLDADPPHWSIAEEIDWVDGVTHYTVTTRHTVNQQSWGYFIIPYREIESGVYNAGPSSHTIAIPPWNPMFLIVEPIDLQQLILIAADVSGIYTLTPGQKHDVLYFNHGGESFDIKIPDPFVKTGFVP